MTSRRSLSRLQRTRIFDAAKGICHLCGVRIHAERGEKWEAEHVNPLWLGGSDDESNMRPAHVHCHKDKSRGEKKVKAKTDRVRARHLGIRKSKHPMRGWRKFDGTPVRKPRAIATGKGT